MLVTKKAVWRLQLGAHGLRVFEDSAFAHLRLNDSPQEKRTTWEITHRGHRFVVPKKTRDGQLLELLADPALKRNVLALRKDYSRTPYGETRLLTIHPSGEERYVGASSLDPGQVLDGEWFAYLHTVGVVPYGLRRDSSKPTWFVQLERAERRARRAMLDSQGWFRLDLTHQRIRELQNRHMVLQSRMHSFTENVGQTPYVAQPPQGIRSYAYRGHRLGILLIALQEEIAHRAGASAIEAHFHPLTAGRFVGRYGWKKLVELQPGMHHYRKEFCKVEQPGSP